MSQHFDTPLITNLIELELYLHVEVVTLFESSIQIQQTDLGPHTRLSQQRHGSNRVSNLVRCLHRVDDLVVEHSADIDLDIILCDSVLVCNVVNFLFQTMGVRNFLNEGQLELEA